MTTASTNILLDTTSTHEARSWLILGGAAGLAVGLAGGHPDAAVRWQPIDFVECSAAPSPPANLGIDEPGAIATHIDAVVIAATPDRGLARRWLLMARQALTGGGRLFIAGANTEGIRPVIGDAKKLFGPAVREDYRAKCRIAVFSPGNDPVDEPAWTTEPGVAPRTWREFPLEIGETSVSLVTQAGVFAGGRIDAGTRLLLDALPDRLTGRVLDIGCGAGAIGIAAALLGADNVDMTDVNLLAIQAAQENIRRLSQSGDGSTRVRPLRHVHAFAGDVYSAVGDARYGLIVSNPPFHRGKAIDYTIADRLIAGAPDHLAHGGSLLVVANAFLAYGKRMARVFSDVETVAATRQYHVLRASGAR